MSSYTKDVFIVNRWILRCAGLWPPTNPSKVVQTSYHIYAVFVYLFVNLYFTATEFLSLFYTYQNLDFFIKNVNFFLTHFMGAVKVTFWFFKGHVLRGLMETLDSPEFQYEPCGDYQPGQIWNQYKKIGFKYTLGFLMLAHMTLSSSYVPPLITAVFHPPYYGNGTHRAFMTSKDRVLERLDNSENLNNEIVRAEMNKEMKRNCRHLQTVLRVCEDLESVHRYLTLGQATATLFILCTCLYLISTTPASSKQFYAEMVYMVAMGFQLYLYCWFGNEVTLKASEIPLYVWKAEWFDCDHSFKKNMVFTMTRMQKPIFMTVGKFAPLTLQTFVYIIRTSYSIFAVIKNTSLGE